MNNNILPSQKFFLYARKSTDVEDKQVRSIEDQITELRAFAKQENLNIIDELVEKQSAKIPGRPIFNEMLKRVEAGEANGILAWHPDRLARNSVDGGRIIYLLDCEHLAMLKFPTFWMENTSQGKFMLNIAFGQSKYYVDSLSENTKRGLRQKVRRGEYPSLAPVGYINDSRNKTVVVDKKQAPIVRKAFELYAQGDQRLEDIGEFLAQHKLVSRSGKRIHISRATFILSNPFYTGLFRYAGEIYEGKHEPIIAKKLFDKVQRIMADRGKPRKEKPNHHFGFLGIFKCGECGRAITAEQHIKKSGLVFRHYRCTKKNVNCTQKYVNEKDLHLQINEIFQKVALPQEWLEPILTKLDEEKKKPANHQNLSPKMWKKKCWKLKTKFHESWICNWKTP